MSAAKKVSRVRKTRAAKIPKGLVMVNLSTWEQKEMRKLARECGLELRCVLRNALCHVFTELREQSRVKRLTGFNIYQQYCFFERGSEGN